MRRYDNPRVKPEWMFGVERFYRENIQRSAGQLAAVERKQHIFLNHMFAAADLDQVTSAAHLLEQGAVEDALRLWSQRQ